MNLSFRLTIWLAVVWVLAGCMSGPVELPCEQDRRCLRYGLSADIPILDPHHADSPEAGMILRQIYDSMVYRDAESHEFVAGLATDWEVSSDGLVYTFNLRRDVTFHDGSRFDAEAVAGNIDRIYDPAMPQSLAREQLGPLTQYEIIGEYTIRLTLASPYAALLEGMSQPFLGMASPDAFATFDSLRYQFHQAGTGPFLLDEYLPGERIVLRRFPEYRVNPATYAPLAGGEIDRVVFLLNRDEDTNVLEALNVSLDVIDDLSPIDAQNLGGNSRVQLLPVEIPGLAVHFLFNTARAHVDSRDVRLALLLATNRVDIIDRVYFNFSAVAWAPLSLSTAYSHTGYDNTYDLDLGRAQALLMEAGYEDSDSDGVMDRDGAPLSLRIIVPPWGKLPEVASLLQQQWRAIGVDLQIEPVPGKTRLASLIKTGQYDLLPVERFGIDPQILNHAFLENTASGASHEPFPRLNNLLLSAMQTLDPQVRRSLYYDIQALIMDEVLILPVRQTVRLTAARADLRDLRFDAYGFYPLLFNASLAHD